MIRNKAVLCVWFAERYEGDGIGPSVRGHEFLFDVNLFDQDRHFVFQDMVFTVRLNQVSVLLDRAQDLIECRFDRGVVDIDQHRAAAFCDLQHLHVGARLLGTPVRIFDGKRTIPVDLVVDI